MKKKSLITLVIIFWLTGCQSFEAIKTVAKMGTTLTSYKTLNNDAVFLCNEMNRIEMVNPFDCAALKTSNDKLNDGVDVMVAYSDALLLAVGDDKFKASDLVEQTLKAGSTAKFIDLNANQLDGVKVVADAVKDLLVSNAKQKALRKTILSIGNDLDKACSGILAQIQVQKQTYTNYKTQINQRFVVDAGFRDKLAGKNAEELKIGLHDDVILFANRYIHEQTQELDKIEQAIKAFQKGHNVLLLEAKSFNIIKKKNDRAALKAIISSLKDIFKGIDNYSTPVSLN